MSNMSAYDNEVPKLDSSPPESEDVTRVGTRDEIARALETESAPSANNLPTPPVPPPDAETRASLGAMPGARLAPPPADLVDPRANDMPTKPPITGVVTESDIEDAFRDTSLDDGGLVDGGLDDGGAVELDSTLLEPAPVSVATPVRATAPPLPTPRVNDTAPLRLTPPGGVHARDIPPAPRMPSMGTGTVKMKAQPKPVGRATDEGEGESGARLKRAPQVGPSPGAPPAPAPLVPTPGGAFVPGPAPEAPHAGEPLITRNPALAALVILGVLAFLVGLFLLRR